ncbi:GNAT family N-acetyltransferase [Hyphobacterium sp. SN044]|uniref:GNAT family N-acetyltransferase n=1 Tax=Hyphobacterium sp. SN044 TaxID=2912575 RepID=UPI001F4530D1|nr:N-acetyltransferase [Hyphobacterium sp. SN044]MCF8880949.1 GNAT family N-acetyltransferase [Hyphobacterium sp. SN044]
MPSPPVSLVRQATRTDLDAIDALETASFDADRFPRRNLRRMLTGGRTIFLIAETGGKTAGYLALSFRKGARVSRLYSLAIAPSARGKGVGTALIACAMAETADRGLRAIRLEVRESNIAARTLYERCGFTLRGRRESYYGDGEAACLYEAQADPGAKEGAPL